LQAAAGKHTYKKDANYQVTLIVKDNLGTTDTANENVLVATPPIADLKITPDAGGPFPLTVVINGKGSVDHHPNGKINSYRIIITNMTNGNQQVFSQDSLTTTFASPANYSVALEVYNNRGLSGSSEKLVPVTNQAPMADFVYNPPSLQGRNRVFTFTSTSRDPNSTDRITNFHWSWGDGSQEQSGSMLSTINHEFTSAGTYFVKLVVTDYYGLTGEKLIQLVVK
jgi:PKD repeat protein